MNDRILLVAFSIFAGVMLIFILISICIYKIGHNNGYDAGFRAGQRDRKRDVLTTKKTRSVNLTNRRYFEPDSVRVLPSRSERPVYIDGRSKYESVDYNKKH